MAWTGSWSALSMRGFLACLTRLKRSSSARAISSPSRSRQAADSWYIEVTPRTYMAVPLRWARRGVAGGALGGGRGGSLPAGDKKKREGGGGTGRGGKKKGAGGAGGGGGM